MSPSRPSFGRSMLSQWGLDPAETYLNHGTVGAVPRVVLAAQHAVQEEIERNPARFLLRELADVKAIPMRMPARMRTAIAPLATFLGADPDDLVFVDNATSGCNAVLRAWDFAPGDEILVTDHGYGAVTMAAQYAAARAGATVRTMTLPWPTITPEAALAAVVEALGPATRMLVIDHVTSGSALILPIAAIAAACRERGVVTLIDGAHAPGMLPLDLPSLGCDLYTGNLHKWAMSPRSSAILWVRREWHARVRPTVISWGYGQGLAPEFDLVGTRDPSAHLAAPAGIAFLESLGLDRVRAYNHSLAYGTAQRFTERWGTTIPGPESMYASMVTIPLPPSQDARPEAVQRLKDELLYEDRIEAQLLAFAGRAWLRLAAQVYNEPADYERLWRALERRSGRA